MSRAQKYVGAFGNGSRMKFIANHLVTIHNLAAAEAMVLGEMAGLDPALVFDVIADSAGSSRMFSDGGQTAGRTTPQQAGAQAANAHIPVTAVAVGTPDGIVQQALQGGFTERFQVPVKPAALQAIAHASSGKYVAGPQSVDVGATYAGLKERAGHKKKSVEVTSAAAGGGLAFMFAGALLSGPVVPEADVRLKGFLGAFALAAAVVAATAPAGGATGECRGIMACIRVAGPWVVVPRRGTADYLLTCPGGRSVVGGLDAQATSRTCGCFDGRLGAPVQPGVTTTRYALFHAVSTARRVQAFQPLIGCMPTQGGGGRSTVSARVTPAGPALEFGRASS